MELCLFRCTSRTPQELSDQCMGVKEFLGCIKGITKVMTATQCLSYEREGELTFGNGRHSEESEHGEPSELQYAHSDFSHASAVRQ